MWIGAFPDQMEEVKVFFAMESANQPHKGHVGLGILLALVAAVIAPRFAAIGDFIRMDEGYHAFISSYIHHSYAMGAGFPSEITGYKLFPYMMAWVWGASGNAMIWLRLGDLLMAILAGWAFCVMLIRESRNPVIGLSLGCAFLLGMNCPAAIDNGFKNSYFPAYLCMFLAVMAASNKDLGHKRWLFAGALTALGVLFRETFAPFPIIGVCSLWINKDFKALWRYALGGIAAAFTVTLILALMRQQIWGIFDFYFTYGKIYGPEAGRRWLKFYENGMRALVLFSPLLALTLIMGWPVLKKFSAMRGRGWFWLACAFVPLLEPFLKIGFVYHFSVCLPGLAGFCAYAFSFAPKKGAYPKFATASALAAVCLMLPVSIGHYKKLPTTLAVLQNFSNGSWPSELTDKSTTLQAAAAAKKILPQGGTMSSSGFAYFLFPAAGLMPPHPGLGDLSRTYIYSGENAQIFNSRLDAHPPDLVFLAKASTDHSETFFPQLKEIFENRPDYELFGDIEQDPEKNYGWLGYEIYRRIRNSDMPDERNMNG